MYVTASNMRDNVIRAKELVTVFIYLVGDFINVFLFSSIFFLFYFHFLCFLSSFQVKYTFITNKLSLVRGGFS